MSNQSLNPAQILDEQMTMPSVIIDLLSMIHTVMHVISVPSGGM